MKQILAKLALLYQRFQIAMRRHHHAHIHRGRLVAADSLHFSLFQHAQQLGLHGQRHVADFVQKDRAALRLFKFADVPPGRAGERSFLVTEQFRLDQLRRNRGAIQRDERT